MKKRVLFYAHQFLPVPNAEGITKHFWGDRLDAFSAGTQAFVSSIVGH
jgi:hypothetical protein